MDCPPVSSPLHAFPSLLHPIGDFSAFPQNLDRPPGLTLFPRFFFDQFQVKLYYLFTWYLCVRLPFSRPSLLHLLGYCAKPVMDSYVMLHKSASLTKHVYSLAQIFVRMTPSTVYTTFLSLHHQKIKMIAFVICYQWGDWFICHPECPQMGMFPVWGRLL